MSWVKKWAIKHQDFSVSRTEVVTEDQRLESNSYMYKGCWPEPLPNWRHEAIANAPEHSICKECHLKDFGLLQKDQRFSEWSCEGEKWNLPRMARFAPSSQLGQRGETVWHGRLRAVISQPAVCGGGMVHADLRELFESTENWIPTKIVACLMEDINHTTFLPADPSWLPPYKTI